MTALQKGYTYFGYLKVAGAIISGLSIFGMMLFIVYDVAGRNFLGGSIRGGFEIVQNYFMPLAIFPALGYVYASGITPKMDLLMPKMPARAQAAVVYVLLIFEVAIFALLIYFSWDYALTGMERGMTFPAAGSLYPLWPLFFLVPLGFALVVVETLFVLARNILGDRVGLAMDEVIYEAD